MVLLNELLYLYPVPSEFPAGFQPGVSHTKLTVTVSYATETGSQTVSLEDSNGVVSGSSTFNVVDATPVTTTFNLVDTGDPFSSSWILVFGIFPYISARTTVSQIEFSS